MSNGKFAKRKGIATKTMFMILAVVLIVGISVGGTLAWLTDTTTPVTNTFTVGDINITLAESENLNLKMVPGNTITKDPKVTVKGDTAFVTVKDSNGEFAPISEVKVISVKKLQLLKIDTIEIRVDEDVALVLDIEKAKENGFDDTIEVTLDKDTLLITSGKDTCIELDIAVLKASDKPVEIQLVEGELSVQLGKNSTMSVDLTKALKTGERIVVKLENGVLKLYDKYNKPIED